MGKKKEKKWLPWNAVDTASISLVYVLTEIRIDLLLELVLGFDSHVGRTFEFKGEILPL